MGQVELFFAIDASRVPLLCDSGQCFLVQVEAIIMFYLRGCRVVVERLLCALVLANHRGRWHGRAARRARHAPPGRQAAHTGEGGGQFDWGGALRGWGKGSPGPGGGGEAEEDDEVGE